MSSRVSMGRPCFSAYGIVLDDLLRERVRRQRVEVQVVEGVVLPPERGNLRLQGIEDRIAGLAVLRALRASAVEGHVEPEPLAAAPAGGGGHVAGVHLDAPRRRGAVGPDVPAGVRQQDVVDLHREIGTPHADVDAAGRPRDDPVRQQP
jgi:hypothetical protein